ncbi:hypothetical protein GCM10023156_45960 [Novipirellula rosea]|uniref:Uncharacterized protein n=1 Tax=Novipirellula rosea TaxID=1031540 RepID=A0ABP8NAZ0_9BACT
MVNVTRYAPETRNRLVTQQDLCTGHVRKIVVTEIVYVPTTTQIEQTYQVHVPYYEQVSQTYRVKTLRKALMFVGE